jgi:hypothetical protein
MLCSCHFLSSAATVRESSVSFVPPKYSEDTAHSAQVQKKGANPGANGHGQLQPLYEVGPFLLLPSSSVVVDSGC